MYSSTPVSVVGLSDAKYVGVGYGHSCAITVDGAVWCWGLNTSGQLGDGTVQSRMTPVAVLGLDGVAVAVTGSANSTCALLADGSVECWGLQYGASPITVTGLTDVVAIDSGITHICAVTSGGAAKCWGTNGLGELGDGRACGSSRCSAPTVVAGLDSGVAAVSAGSLYSCAVLTDGTAKCWGNNTYGQLGSGEAGSGKQSSVPLDVVEEIVKPAPTSTPCPPGGCPTPTPRPIPPLTGIDFSMAIDIDGDGTLECGTRSDQPHGCVIPPLSNFKVVVYLNALDAIPGAYDGFDVSMQFDGVQTQGNWLTFWPDCAFPAQYVEAMVFKAGCSIGIDAKPSTYVGQLVSVRFNCNESGNISLYQSNDHGSTDVIDDGLNRHHENGDEVLHIVCGPLERGDNNCDSEVNAVDAALTLQYDAAIVPNVDCPQQSDVNLDSLTNAVDANLTLQYDATLIDTLPPNQLR